MDITHLLRSAWRITFKNWPLWAITFVMVVALVPATALSGGFGAGAALVALPLPPGPQPEWLIQIRRWPTSVWLIVALVTLLVTVATSALTWLLQAASMRGAAIAAERGVVTLGEALRLGRQRVTSLLTLSLTFGALIAALGLLPVVLHLLLANLFPDLGRLLLQSTQTLLSPLLGALGVALLVVMMAIALEDMRPRAAFRRAWVVFRSGWWGFVVVIGLTVIATFALALLLVPIIMLPAVTLVFSPAAALLVGLCACGLGGPLGLALMLLVAVYTQVLYTLIYRAAAQRADAGRVATGAPT
jgi:hypothetical protein